VSFFYAATCTNEDSVGQINFAEQLSHLIFLYFIIKTKFPFLKYGDDASSKS